MGLAGLPYEQLLCTYCLSWERVVHLFLAESHGLL